MQQFTQAPPPIIELTVDISPFSYTAVEPGFIFIEGGTVSLITLRRGAAIISFLGQLVPVSIGDEVEVTWSVLPVIVFIPIYGAAPR